MKKRYRVFEGHGLTEPQAEAAYLIGRGHAPKEVAKMIGRTVTSLYERLGYVYKKLKVNNAAELRVWYSDARDKAGE